MDPVQVDKDRCKGCGLCVEFCPKHLLELAPELNAIGYHPAQMHNPEKCTSCGLCATMCPEAGMKVYRKHKAKPDEKKVEGKK